MVAQGFNDDVIAPGRSCPDLTSSVEMSECEIRTDSDKIIGSLNQPLSNGTVAKKRPDLAIDLSDVAFTEPSPGQKCFGEKSDVERVLDSRCPCLQSKCLHLSGTFLVLLIFGAVVIYFFRRYLKDCLEWLEHTDGWISGLLFIVMFTLVSFPMTWGYIFLNVASGYLYGFLMGLVTVNISVLVGVATSLVVCRKLIRGFVTSKLQSEHLKAIVKVVESRRGFKVLVLTRLTPIPFGLQNGLFAITNMPISKCLLGSFIGLLPTQALNAYVGSTLRTMEDVVHSNSAGGYLLLGVQVGISGFLMWYVIRRARYELNKACLPNTNDIDYSSLTNYSKNKKTEMVKTPQPLTRALSNGFSKYELLPTSDNEEEITIKGNKNSAKKQGHKRAHSASAILYALQNRDADN